MLTVTLLALACKAPAQGYWVKTVGTSASAGNIRQAVILVDTIQAEHLYAIGEPADGRGEIFLWDNAVFVAAVTPDTREPYVRRMVKDLDASYLLYTNVPKWDTIVLTQPVLALSELETAIAEAAAGHGIDTTQAFPFLLIGKIKSGEGDITFSDSSTTNSTYVFPLHDKRAQMIGFHRGGSAGMRIHFRLQNKYHAGRLSAADFDESEPIRLFLPKI
jgi:hypothetical protein